MAADSPTSNTPPPPSEPTPPHPPVSPSMKMINGVAHKVNSTREDGVLSVMDLLVPGGRKFVELGSASPPEVEEEEGADAAITPETLSQKKKKPGHFLFLFFCKLFIPP